MSRDDVITLLKTNFKANCGPDVSLIGFDYHDEGNGNGSAFASFSCPGIKESSIACGIVNGNYADVGASLGLAAKQPQFPENMD
jgi:hypothetical protein